MRPYVTPTHTPGLVGFLTTGYARCESFWTSLQLLEVPDGTAVMKLSGTGIPAMLNQLVRAMRPADQWLFLLADDHSFAPDLLRRMLARASVHDCPILIPLVCKKGPPFDSVMFQGDGTPLDFHDLPAGDAPVPVWAAGTAGVLIQRRVIDAVGSPWFAFGWQTQDSVGEDVFFCRKAAEKGFQTFIDPTCSMTHIPAEIALSPVREKNGHWYLRFQWPDGQWFQIPMERPQRPGPALR